MRILKLFLYPLFLTIFLSVSSCTKESDTLEPIPTEPVMPKEIMLNVAYGADPLQKMDVYLPAGRSVSSTKVIVMIHGGAWSSGDKSEMTAYVDTLQRRLTNYAIINLNYRLAASPSTNIFPTQEMDVKAAVEYINGKRSEYAVSPKFVMLGASAGAHLALLQAYKYTTPIKMKAVVDFFGPADMTAMYNDPAPFSAPSQIAILMGGTPTSNPTIYQYSSPQLFVTSTTSPTIILHGGADPIVKFSQSAALRDKLVSNGVSNDYVFYPGEGHGWIGANLTNSFDRIQTFLNTYVQ